MGEVYQEGYPWWEVYPGVYPEVCTMVDTSLCVYPEVCTMVDTSLYASLCVYTRLYPYMPPCVYIPGYTSHLASLGGV